MEAVDDLHRVAHPADPCLDQWSAALAPAQLVQSLRLEMADCARCGAGPWIGLFVMIHEGLPVRDTGALDRGAHIGGGAGMRPDTAQRRRAFAGAGGSATNWMLIESRSPSNQPMRRPMNFSVR